MQMPLEEVMEFFGLTRTEARVYLTLLDLGPSLAGIISRKSGIHRRSVYDATERLIKKGLIGYIMKNNRRYFEAVDPDRLIELLKEKEDAVNNILPVLKQKYKVTQEKQETNFYKGKNGLKTVFEDQLNIGKEILVLGASQLASDYLKYYMHWYTKRRLEKGIRMRLIYNEKRRTREAIRLASIRYLPIEYPSHAATNIYGDRVAIILWSKEKPFAILIKDQEIAKGYKSYFEHLWQLAKK